MNRRLVAGSLLVIALFSGAVVVEAERNYAAVTAVERTDARVDAVWTAGGDLEVRIAVENSMPEALRLQFAHLTVERVNHTDAASVPYNGYRTLPPGQSTLTTGIPERKLTGGLSPGETVVVGGYLSVEVFNGYRFDVPVEKREVTL